MPYYQFHIPADKDGTPHTRNRRMRPCSAHQGSLELLTDPVAEALTGSANRRGWPTPDGWITPGRADLVSLDG